jgi:putative colanic acid biosynthesis glycosyltransferase
MKVMQLDVNYGYSSTGAIVQCLQRELRLAGHECLALFGRGEHRSDDDAIRVANPMEVIVHAGLTRVTGITGYFSPFATSRVNQLMKLYRPDVLHIHEPHGYYVNFEAVLLQAQALKVAIVWTFHCEFSYTGKCGYALDCENWVQTCGKCPQLKTYPRSEFFDGTKWMHRRKAKLFEKIKALQITAPSEWLAARARRSIAGLHPVTSVPNPIDTTIFYPRGNEKSVFRRYGIDAPIVILTVGSQIMTPLKGGRLIAGIAAAVKRKDVQFLIVGVEPHEAGRYGSVFAVEKISDKDELAKLYSAADLVMLTSQRETFSMVCAESLACGTPIIGFDAGAVPFVAPRGFGLFAPYPEIKELAYWIEFFENTRMMLKTATECSEFAHLNYSPLKVTRQYLDIYERAYFESGDK